MKIVPRFTCRPGSDPASPGARRQGRSHHGEQQPMGDATPPPRPGRAPAGSRPTGAGLAAATEPARVAPVGQGQPHPRERCNERRAATRAENVSAVRARGSDVHRRYEEPDPGRRCPFQAARVTPPRPPTPAVTMPHAAHPVRVALQAAHQEGTAGPDQARAGDVAGVGRAGGQDAGRARNLRPQLPTQPQPGDQPLRPKELGGGVC